MSAPPLVTIGCAVYNGDRTLERALATLTSQTYPHIELLLSDDGSTDRSIEICKEVALRDSRVRLLTNPTRLGVTRNCNKLFAEASGKYFMWADQDDLRDTSFIAKAVAILEADPGVVLCHGQSGVFVEDPADVKLIVTFSGISGVASRSARYWRFLREYADTTIYGLIRTDALRRTRLWRPHLGSANALLFELLLLGTFVEIPEVLYFYAGRGLGTRPGPSQEYERMNIGRTIPWYYRPFLVLAVNQTDGIWRSPAPLHEKVVLLLMLWAHVGMVGATKVIYRLLDRLALGRVPEWFTRACTVVVAPGTHYVFVNGANRDLELFPPAWALRKRS